MFFIEFGTWSLKDTLTRYIGEIIFRVKFKYSRTKNIKAGVPQGSELGPILHQFYTSDIRISNDTPLASFADDMTITMEKSSKNHFISIPPTKKIKKYNK